MDPSEAYRGPLVVFTSGELEYIYQLIHHGSLARNLELEESIQKKIAVAKNTDPKFREPMK